MIISSTSSFQNYSQTAGDIWKTWYFLIGTFSLCKTYQQWSLVWLCNIVKSLKSEKLTLQIFLETPLKKKKIWNIIYLNSRFVKMPSSPLIFLELWIFLQFQISTKMTPPPGFLWNKILSILFHISTINFLYLIYESRNTVY